MTAVFSCSELIDFRSTTGNSSCHTSVKRLCVDCDDDRWGVVRMLSGKTAVVTGSTSGIGLGIAKVLAGQGANIVLNGFGDRAVVEEMRSQLAREHNVGVSYSQADIS